MNPHRTPGETIPDGEPVPDPPVLWPGPEKWTDPVWCRFFELVLPTTAQAWTEALYMPSIAPEDAVVNRAERIADEAWRRQFTAVDAASDYGGIGRGGP